MSTQPATLVTQDMVDRKDKFSDPRVSPPIALADIRKWAIAVYWPESVCVTILIHEASPVSSYRSRK